MINTRRELDRINRQFDQYHRSVGEGVLWYEYHAEESVPDNYLNAGGRKYRPGILVPVLWISEYEDDESASAEGRRYTPTLRFAMSVNHARKAGISDVEDARRHLNDIVLYSRTLWNVGSYQIRGRLRQESTVIGISAIKLFPDEDMNFDELPTDIDFDWTERSESGINLENEDSSGWMVFPDHDSPARHS